MPEVYRRVSPMACVGHALKFGLHDQRCYFLRNEAQKDTLIRLLPISERLTLGLVTGISLRFGLNLRSSTSRDRFVGHLDHEVERIEFTPHHRG